MTTRRVLIALALFQALTAIAGGISLVAEWIAPGLELLEGSPFESYVVPGVALTGVGVVALIAALAIGRQHPLGLPLAVLAGIAMIGFEFVEVLVIGYHFLQVLYAIEGAIIVILAARLWPRNDRIGPATAGRAA